MCRWCRPACMWLTNTDARRHQCRQDRVAGDAASANPGKSAFQTAFPRSAVHLFGFPGKGVAVLGWSTGIFRLGRAHACKTRFVRIPSIAADSRMAMILSFPAVGADRGRSETTRPSGRVLVGHLTAELHQPPLVAECVNSRARQQADVRRRCSLPERQQSGSAANWRCRPKTARCERLLRAFSRLSRRAAFRHRIHAARCRIEPTSPRLLSRR